MGFDYCVIESLRERNGKKVRKIDRVRIADAKAGNVEMLVRYYEQPKKKIKRKPGDVREVWALPIVPTYTYQWEKFNNYLCRVYMIDD